jgi:5'-3' exonuclease
MGIHHFGKLLKSVGINCELLNLTPIGESRIILVDIYNFYYKSTRSKGLKVAKNPHIQGIFNLISFLRAHGFIPICVFDGKPPVSKIKLIEARKIKANKQLPSKKWEAPKVAEPIDEVEAEASYGISNQITDIIQLLQLLGIPYVRHHQYEAEMVCAWMCSNFKGKIFGVLGDDWDLLILGCPVLRNLNFSAKTVEFYDPVAIRNQLELTTTQLMDLVIMMGCEYSEHIIGIDGSELLNLLRALHTGHATAEFISHNYTSNKKVKVPNIEFDSVRSRFRIPDLDFMKHSYNMANISKFQENSPRDTRFIKSALYKLCPDMKQYIIDEKLGEIFQ